MSKETEARLAVGLARGVFAGIVYAGIRLLKGPRWAAGGFALIADLVGSPKMREAVELIVNSELEKLTYETEDVTLSTHQPEEKETLTAYQRELRKAAGDQ